MDRDNVTSIEAHKLADLMIAEWVSAYSDNGALWERDYKALDIAKRDHSEDIIREAFELARERWNRMYNID